MSDFEPTPLELGIQNFVRDAEYLGLYFDMAFTQVSPDPADHGEHVGVIQFNLGDLAFSKETLNPIEETYADEFMKIKRNETVNDFKQIKDDIAKKLKEGKSIFDD